MALSVEQKAQIIKDFQRKEGDTGSSEVQVALLTFRINDLTSHFKANPKDHHSRRGEKCFADENEVYAQNSNKLFKLTGLTEPFFV